MIYKRASKCEPLLRFYPLNLAKIACFANWVYGAKSVPSDFLYKRVSIILTWHISNMKVQIIELVNLKLWDALFYPEQSVEFC